MYALLSKNGFLFVFGSSKTLILVLDANFALHCIQKHIEFSTNLSVDWFLPINLLGVLQWFASVLSVLIAKYLTVI